MEKQFREVFLPYCLDRQPDGRYAVLNRRYKPLGFATSDWMNYAEFPVLVQMSMTPTRAAAISFRGDQSTDRIYLYNDGCIPTDGNDNWLAYQGRLAKLAKLIVT